MPTDSSGSDQIDVDQENGGEDERGSGQGTESPTLLHCTYAVRSGFLIHNIIDLNALDFMLINLHLHLIYLISNMRQSYQHLGKSTLWLCGIKN